MPSVADVAFLDKALADLETARKWTPRTLSKLEALINSDDPWALYRVDPLRFAASRGIAETEAIDLFLHAAHLGLFQMEWRLLCPQCSDTVSSCRSMSTVQARCFCQLCQMAVEVNLDDYITVSFNLSPRVKTLLWHNPEDLSAQDYLLRYRIDSQAAYEGMGPMTDILKMFAKFFDHVKPGESRTVETEIPPGFAAVGFDAAMNSSFILAAGHEPPVKQSVRAELANTGWKLSATELRPGPLSITFVNSRSRPVPVAFYVRPNEGESPVLNLGVFLSGNRLVNNQTFRTLFRAETLPNGEGLGVRDLTLLFTDLKGSTELYERVGDLSAFALVQQHFEHLRRAVQAQDGAVVKTIGDAVMASFVHPQQAVRASLAMFREIEEFNRSRGKRELILKIGVHRGHTIAVTLNERLDYFGQTVNIAARVQGVANADEICLTEDMYELPTVQEALKGHTAKPELAQLKGIQESVAIRRVRVVST
jgi:class 3 adenylate cyclase